MWANDQRGHPLFNVAVWLMLTTRCRAVTLPRHETRSNLQGCPKLANRSQPLLVRSSPYCGDTWRIYCCLTSFFPIVDMCLSCEDIARQSCAMVPRWRFLATFFAAHILVFDKFSETFSECLEMSMSTAAVQVWHSRLNLLVQWCYYDVTVNTTFSE